MNNESIITAVNEALNAAGIATSAKLSRRTSIDTGIEYVELTWDSESTKVIEAARKVVGQVLTGSLGKPVYKMSVGTKARKYYTWNLYFNDNCVSRTWKSYRAGMTWKAA